MKRSMIVLTLAVATLGVLFWGRSRAFTTSQSQVNPPVSKVQKRERDKLVYRGSQNAREERLEDAASRLRDDVTIERGVGFPVLSPDTVITNDSIVRAATCQADAVVLGETTTKTSRLTDDGTFIYTVNNFQVSDVLVGEVSRFGPIQILRAGGSVTLNGRKLTAIDRANHELKANERYLLFLTFADERKAYIANGLALRLAEGKATVLSDAAETRQLNGVDVLSVLGMVRTSVSKCQGGAQ